MPRFPVSAEALCLPKALQTRLPGTAKSQISHGHTPGSHTAKEMAVLPAPARALLGVPECLLFPATLSGPVLLPLRLLKASEQTVTSQNSIPTLIFHEESWFGKQAAFGIQQPHGGFSLTLQAEARFNTLH